MKENRISIKDFAALTGYSVRNLYYLRKSKPELLGYDENFNTYGRAEAKAISKVVNNHYTITTAAMYLGVSQKTIRYHSKKEEFGTLLGHKLFLSNSEVECIGSLCGRRSKSKGEQNAK